MEFIFSFSIHVCCLLSQHYYVYGLLVTKFLIVDQNHRQCIQSEVIEHIEILYIPLLLGSRSGFCYSWRVLCRVECLLLMLVTNQHESRWKPSQPFTFVSLIFCKIKKKKKCLIVHFKRGMFLVYVIIQVSVSSESDVRFNDLEDHSGCADVTKDLIYYFIYFLCPNSQMFHVWQILGKKLITMFKKRKDVMFCVMLVTQTVTHMGGTQREVLFICIVNLSK